MSGNGWREHGQLRRPANRTCWPARMPARPLWKVSIATTPEAEAAVSALLTGIFGQPASAYTQFPSRRTEVAVYLAGQPDGSVAAHRALAAGLARIRARGLRVGTGRLTKRRVPREDWAESWKRHFHPLEISPRLLIRPSWSRRRARKGQAVVVLDPGMSFGTGQHPTTAFCLHQLADARRPGHAQSCLDLGTGSGILALAAARLGYSPVVAIDVDAEAVAIARANARRNRLSAAVCFQPQDVQRLPQWSAERFSVVCANLATGLLLSERDRILARLAGGGRVILSGILRKEFSGIQAAYQQAGLRQVASRAEGAWRSGSFAAPQGHIRRRQRRGSVRELRT